MKIKSNKYYYGTCNPDLDIKIPIDPTHPNDKKFEFGNGFYLTEYKNVAEGYIIRQILSSYLNNVNLKERKNKDKLADGSIYNCGYIHTYTLDLKKIAEESIRYCTNMEDYKKVLENTIDGYSKDLNYTPNYKYTYGFICGPYWDEVTKENDLNKDIIEECMKNMLIVEDDNGNDVEATQLCLHKDRGSIIDHSWKTISINNETKDEEHECENIM